MKVHEFMHEMSQTSAILGRTSGIRVIFEGDKAKTDGKTIWLPALPQDVDLTHEQVMAMRGYVDHEAGHNRHSNMERIISFYDKNNHNDRPELSQLHNALEDTWMEAKVIEEYPGAWKNLKQTNRMVKTRELDNARKMGEEAKELLDSNKNLASGLAITSTKDLYGYQEEHEGLFELLGEERVEMGKHWNKLALECENSDDVIELAKKVYQYVEQKGGEDMSPEEFDQMVADGELPDLDEGDNSPDFKEGKENGRPKEAKGKGKPSPLEEATNDIGKVLTAADDTRGAGGIGSCMDNGLTGGYKVASTANDKVYRRGEPFNGGTRECYNIVNDTTHYPQYEQQKLSLKAEITTMKNKLRRSLMARQQRDWDYGRERGRLDSKRLVAASQGVKQVYKRRTDRQDHDTAISILIDLSGSMGGSKARVTRDCAIALAECFEGTQMKYRVVGFSNNGDGGHSGKGKYHRYERTDTTIFKDYDDTLRITRGSIYLIDDAVGGNNSDYDFVNAELFGLSRRPEARKVLFVLSDGHVSCHTDAAGSEHVKLIRNNLKHYKKLYGVESVGIGIKSNAVEKIYPDNVVINDVNELSQGVFNMLTSILFRDQQK